MNNSVDLFQWASGHYLTAELPDNYRDMGNAELHQFCVDHAWEPFEHWDPVDVLEHIEVLADSVEKLLNERDRVEK